MEASLEHREFLKKKFVPAIPLSPSKFSRDEIALLLKFGAWYQAINDGVIKAITVDQRHFLACASGQSMPKTEHEIVWSRYIQALRDAFPSGGSDRRDRASGVAGWNRASYDEIIASQKAAADG
jgi:uncharacterized protein YifE (UPF0438 family)